MKKLLKTSTTKVATSSEKIDVLEIVENLVETAKDSSYRISSSSSGDFKSLSGKSFPSTRAYLKSKLFSSGEVKFSKYSIGFYLVEEVLRRLDSSTIVEVEIDLETLVPRRELKSPSLTSKLKDLVEDGLSTNLISSRSAGYRSFIKSADKYDFIVPKSSVASRITIRRKVVSSEK